MGANERIERTKRIKMGSFEIWQPLHGSKSRIKSSNVISLSQIIDIGGPCSVYKFFKNVLKDQCWNPHGYGCILCTWYSKRVHCHVQ